MKIIIVVIIILSLIKSHTSIYWTPSFQLVFFRKSYNCQIQSKSTAVKKSLSFVSAWNFWLVSFSRDNHLWKLMHLNLNPKPFLNQFRPFSIKLVFLKRKRGKKLCLNSNKWFRKFITLKSHKSTKKVMFNTSICWARSQFKLKNYSLILKNKPILLKILNSWLKTSTSSQKNASRKTKGRNYWTHKKVVKRIWSINSSL
jgi:hypothetical protein